MTLHILPVPAAAAAHFMDFRDTGRLIADSHHLAAEELSLLRTGASVTAT